ncbi:hypothetical protein HYH02_014173 [Chlamydomonas schloesseri]|uniref:Protein kinase domain-containing protein n=1 Tax=Chlamydomonas schloesseri TaxID=2026947 RepID=A0A835SP10_9CHLO|nr:hypothetical protein HYH02_014173 [Chlamydomonas schloesseri]|eukprot:KAG2429136.1 hypothetical protein HYH02_014173 [Chlamydomonas schloesseri]
MVLTGQAPGAAQPLPAEEAKKDDRIRVRLHFGGKFAQDAPNLWRYVGGEVFNESFPLEAKYADVCLRLNDKFGDTVSFKYLCPGDELDPDNLVQVQGDDDLTEMKDEYAHAVGDARSRTVRLKIYVFRAVIFEREVQDQDAELEDEELMGEPGGVDVSMDASCGAEECGPNWSDWGEPDEPEATESSLPSAQPSMDAEVHRSASAAVASAAATAALQNISMSMTSGASGRTSARGMAAPLSASMTAGGSAGGQGAGFSSRRSSAGWQVQALTHQRALSGTEGCGGAGGGSGLSRSGRSGSMSAAVAAAVAGEGGDVGGGYTGYPFDPLGVFPEEGGYHGEQDVEHYGEEEQGDGDAADEGLGYAYDEQAGAYADGAGYEEAGYEVTGGDAGSTYWDPPLVFPEEVLGAPDGAERRGSGPERPLRASAPDWHLPADRPVQSQEQQQAAEQQASKQLAGVSAKADAPQQQKQPEQQEALPDRGVMNSCIGFYCNEELEDPYGEQYDNNDSAAAAAAGLGLYGMQLTDDGRGGRGYGAASDGALPMVPRAADVAADGNGELGDPSHGAGVFAALRGAEAGNRRSSNGGTGAGAGVLSRAVLGRLAAAADMLPRHISAFGESSRDNSQGGGAGAGAANGSGPFLPSRITIFGDDDSINGSGPDSGAIGAGKQAQGNGNGNNTGGLHRLALLGGTGGAQRWPDATGGVGGGEAGEGGGFPVNGSLVGDSGRCITQEFGAQQQSSLLDLGDGGEGGSLGGAHGGGDRGRMSPLDPLLLRTGGLGLGGLGLLDDHHLGGSGGGAMNHPLKGVVKKRKSEVTIMAKIGEGAFGEVSQAMVFPYGIVAVKWLKRERFAKYSESFQREAETLAKLNHPNIIRMYGLVMDTPATEAGGSGGSGGGNGGGSGGAGGSGGGNAAVPASSGAGTPTGLIGGIITEFVRNGSLGQYLRSLNGRRLSLRQRAMIALQAALGMAYLHEQAPAVVHFDLKPDNLLVDGEGDSMVIKVADFGLSKHKLSSHVSCRDLRGTLPYMAYELVSNAGNISEKVDVYSMGVVMWEMYTGEVPFAHLSAQEILMGLLHGSLHLAIPPSCEPEWRSLVETCMDPNPANRPSFQELAMQLQEILRLERQASNASSASAAAVAAAAAAFVESTTGTATQQQQAQQGRGAGGDSDGAGPSTTSGRAMAPPAAVLPTPQAAVAAAAAAAAPPLLPQHGLPQWRLPITPIVPPAAPAGPSLPSPGALGALGGQGLAPTPQGGHGLLGRQPLQLPPHPPPPHTPSPLLAQLAGGSQQPQAQQQQQQPYGLPSPQLFVPASPADLQYGGHGVQLPSPGHQQPPAPQLLAPQPPRPAQPLPMPPQPQQLQFQPQPPIGPSAAIGLAPPGGLVPQNGAYGFPLRPEPLFPPQPQHIGLNAFYGMGGGAGAGPPLVSWGERGRG